MDVHNAPSWNARKNSPFRTRMNPASTIKSTCIVCNAPTNARSASPSSFVRNFPGGTNCAGIFRSRACAKDPRVFDIAQHDGYLRRNFARRHGVGNRGKVRPFAGTENTQTKFIAHGNLNNRVTAQNKLKGGDARWLAFILMSPLCGKKEQPARSL